MIFLLQRPVCAVSRIELAAGLDAACSYGAYGSKQWPTLNPADLTLLDRGFLLAVAHVRGGGELGAAWHIDGKLYKKTNTFKARPHCFDTGSRMIWSVQSCLLSRTKQPS